MAGTGMARRRGNKVSLSVDFLDNVLPIGVPFRLPTASTTEMSGLTSSQKEAISLIKGNVQLIACAGSGKTEVVARRIANLLAPTAAGGAGLKPANIVAFTFTEKAAAELRERVFNRCRNQHGHILGLAEMYIGTIYGFCLDLLKTEVPEFLKYDVLSDVQQTLFIDRSSKKTGLTTARTLQGRPLRRFVDTGIYKQALAILRESRLNAKELVGNSIVEGLELYRQQLRARSYLDYSAILAEAVHSLRTDSRLRAHIQLRIKSVIVDEYQDVNPIQEELVHILRELGADIGVVGDDDQTIYQWRGSDVSNIIEFSDRYKPVSTARLEDNFRSTSGIVETARLVVTKIGKRLPKTMRSAKVQTFEIGDLVALQFDSARQEADYIAATCHQLLGTLIRDGDDDRAIAWSDMAILVRVNAAGEIIRERLRHADVPVVSIGMSTLFDAPEAEAARQLFYMMAGRVKPKAVTDAWLQADLGVSPTALKKAVADANVTRGKMENESEEVRFSVYNLQRQFIGFLEAIGLLEERVANDRGALAFYNLAKFSQAISDFESIHFHSAPKRKYDSFADFLLHQAEAVYGEASTDERLVSPDAVQILTIHQAKGLQWPVVFVPQLVRNRFPIKSKSGINLWHLLPAASVEGQSRFSEFARRRATPLLRGGHPQPETPSPHHRSNARKSAVSASVGLLARRP